MNNFDIVFISHGPVRVHRILSLDGHRLTSPAQGYLLIYTREPMSPVDVVHF